MKAELCRVKYKLFLLFFFILLGPILFAQEEQIRGPVNTVQSEFSDLIGERLRNPGAILDDPLLEILGKNLIEVFSLYGDPQSVTSVRGPQEWQDDVVFLYRDFSELYWFQDRVWQVRFTSNYRDSFFGIEMNLPQNRVRSQLGEPYWEASGQMIYNCKDQGFPARLRLIFNNDQLTDAYVYRSDF